ncbi:hypothetical protein [Helicobacter sp. NHP22-001]|uniref:hypothetical protein n=1 Tax=Helicobacter sp. NHP22-001 TaxID=3040202 RepID=UPI00244D84CC|nr:hypothetical protein [Helicobacter sp. NHP22-001]GMB96950.1 hypothetical protein NHP22001_15410 [Helicobacter sp. NHP22-001]
MGNIASINFKPTNNIQLQHNDRSLPPTYLLAKELGYGCEWNRSGDNARVLRDELVRQAIEQYRQNFNRSFKSTSHLWSAVLNIKPTTTMQDLEKLAKHFKDKYGFQCYQIAIHRDEGHVDESGNVCINHHAHMEFVMLDALTGKNVFRTINRQHLREIQSEVAKILDMKRGEYKGNFDEFGNRVKGTGRKRIEPRAYAQLMEQEKAKRIELGKSNAEEVSTYKEQIESLKTNAKNTKTELNTLKQEKNKLEQANTTLQQANTTLTKENQELKDGKAELETKNTEHAKALQTIQQEIATLKTTNQELQQENLKLKPMYLTKEQIKARRLAEKQELMGKGCPKEAFRELSALDDERLTQAQLDARILNIWLKYAPSYIANLENTNANLEQETQALKTELKTAKTEAKSQAHIKTFEKQATALIRKYVAPVTSGVVAHIQASGEKITEIHQQCQEEMLQQASVCVVFGEELKAGKFKIWNDIKKFFGKGVKDPITYEYVEWGKIHYRELNRREQAIKKDLADTLNKHSQEVQSINNQACQVILGAVESVKNEITKLATEFKDSAEYGAELSSTKRQVESLEKDKERLQGKVSVLEKEKKSSQQELQEAQANKEALKQKGIENTELKNDLKSASVELQTTKTTLQTTQSNLETTKAELEKTKAQLENTQGDLGALEILEGAMYAKIAEIGKASPEVAQALKIRANNTFNDLASLREELPRALAQVKAGQEKQEQDQKGDGCKHI